MRIHHFLVVLLPLALLAPVSFAGSQGSPEITDPAGDTSNHALDVTAVWITNDANNVYFHVKVVDLASPNPATAGLTRYHWRVDFDADGVSHQFVDGQVHLADTSVAGVGNHGCAVAACYGAGTTADAGGSNGDVKLDAANDIVLLTFSRTTGTRIGQPFFLAAGTSLSNIAVTTGSSSKAVMPTALSGPFVGPAFDLADTAAGGAYTIG